MSIFPTTTPFTHHSPFRASFCQSQYLAISSSILEKVAVSYSPPFLSQALTPSKMMPFHLGQKPFPKSIFDLVARSLSLNPSFCRNFSLLAVYMALTLTTSQSFLIATSLPAAQAPIPGPEFLIFQWSLSLVALHAWKQFSALQYSLPSTLKGEVRKLSVAASTTPSTCPGPPILCVLIVMIGPEGYVNGVF